MEFVEIGESGQMPEQIILSSFVQQNVIPATVEHYGRVGFERPWIGYLAVREGVPVGTCGFKSAPVDGRVEIAYGTSPGHEGQGIATAMARELVSLAREHRAGVEVFAQTLPEQNASTSILTKLGFLHTGTVEHPEDGTVWEWTLAPDSGPTPAD